MLIMFLCVDNHWILKSSKFECDSRIILDNRQVNNNYLIIMISCNTCDLMKFSCKSEVFIANIFVDDRIDFFQMKKCLIKNNVITYKMIILPYGISFTMTTFVSRFYWAFNFWVFRTLWCKSFPPTPHRGPFGTDSNSPLKIINEMVNYGFCLAPEKTEAIPITK